MGKINLILKAVGISTAIFLSNTNVIAAEESSTSNQYLDNSKFFNSQYRFDDFFTAEALSTVVTSYPKFGKHDFRDIGYIEFQGMKFTSLANNPENLQSQETSPISFEVSPTQPLYELSQKTSTHADNESGRVIPDSIPATISQSTPPQTPSQSTPDLLESSEEPIPNVDILNPSANPLLFPTQPAEVDVNDPQPITLEQAIRLAVKNNTDIEVSRLNLERSQEELRQARAALYPTLSTSVQVQNARSSGGDIAEAELEIQQAENPLIQPTTATNATSTGLTGALSFNYDIYAGGGRSADIRRARRQLRFNELDLETTVEQTRFDTSSDYYALQNSDAQVEIQRAAVEDAQQTLRDAQLLEQAGLGTRFEALQAEVELAQAQQQLTTAVSNQNVARRQLAETLNLGQQVNLRSADAIEQAGDWNLNLPQSIVLAYKNRAELEQFLLQREINDAQRQIALATIRPQVSLTGSYDILNAFDDDIDQLGDGYAIGALVQWQFYDGGAARALADQEDTDIDIAETQFAAQRDLVRFEVEQAYYGLEANRENINTATRGVDLAEESLRLARLRFQAGVGTQTDVITAQAALTQARGDLVTAIINYNLSYVQLQRAITNLPDNGLYDLP